LLRNETAQQLKRKIPENLFYQDITQQRGGERGSNSLGGPVRCKGTCPTQARVTSAFPRKQRESRRCKKGGRNLHGKTRGRVSRERPENMISLYFEGHLENVSPRLEGGRGARRGKTLVTEDGRKKNHQGPGEGAGDEKRGKSLPCFYLESKKKFNLYRQRPKNTGGVEGKSESVGGNQSQEYASDGRCRSSKGDWRVS